MDIVDKAFIKHSYAGEDSVKEYSDATRAVSLWKSEEIVFERYLKTADKILDLGCGTGRVAFGLVEKGYNNISGVDLSEDMIAEAKKICRQKQIDIPFYTGDATDLAFEEESFDAVIFAFNGIMQIPGETNRLKSMAEIARILKKDGVFIFTTHDRDKEKDNESYWKQEKYLWNKNRQDRRLVEFGDLIYSFHDREMFIHVPDREEVLKCLAANNLLLLEDIFRDEIVQENDIVKEFADECRFWIVKKQ